MSGADDFEFVRAAAGGPDAATPDASTSLPAPTRDAAPDDPLSDASADADIPEADAGPSGHRVFVTSDQFPGNLGGLAGADEKCQAAATRGGLGGTWVAWVSTGASNAIDRIPFDGRYVLLDGREVVARKTGLMAGQLTNAIDTTEALTVVSGSAADLRVWTGTEGTGLRSKVDRCNDFATNAVNIWGIMGDTSRSDRGWTQAQGVLEADGGWGCQTMGHIYCFEQ